MSHEETVRKALEDASQEGPHSSSFTGRGDETVGDRETAYQKRRYQMDLGEERVDAFASSSSSSSKSTSGKRFRDLHASDLPAPVPVSAAVAVVKGEDTDKGFNAPSTMLPVSHTFDATPVASSGLWDATPVAGSGVWTATPSGKRARSRWDETPVAATASVATVFSTAAQSTVDPRFRIYTDEELDAMLPSTGYTILVPPSTYKPVINMEKLQSTPAPTLFSTPAPIQHANLPEELADVPLNNEDDARLFGLLMEDSEKDTSQQAVERQVLTFLLKIKNGTATQRRTSSRVLTEKCRSFGAKAVFGALQPILTSPSLEDQERHFLVKVLDKQIHRLDELVRPFVHQIFRVAQPMLLDSEYYARAEAREIIANVCKAAGLAVVIAAVRPDIDSTDEYVRNVNSRTLAVMCSALGVTRLLPFQQAICTTTKSWEARHTGFKAIQQLALLLGIGVLPYLRSIVDLLALGLGDENLKVRTMAALSVSALAEASFPYGIDAFEAVLRPLWEGLRMQKGKSLAAFLKAVGYIVALMSPAHAATYALPVFEVVVREFGNTEEEMRLVVLRTTRQLLASDQIKREYLVEHVLQPFLRAFWVRQSAYELKTATEVTEATVALSLRIGPEAIVQHILVYLRDENEALRRMAVLALAPILTSMKIFILAEKTEQSLVEGLLHAVQATSSDNVMRDVLQCVGTVFTAMGVHAKPYLSQLFGLTKWRLNNKNPAIRKQAAELISIASHTAVICEETVLLSNVSSVLFESLGEEYPEVLTAILKALTSIANNAGVEVLTPPLAEVIPHVTPILKNRTESVQQAVVELLVLAARDGGDQVHQKEWVRISFDLLDFQKANRKNIRKTAALALGAIAGAVGPHEVLGALLQNLRVADRTSRVTTGVALAVIAESCQPFTVLPAIMNEYTHPDPHVQQGILKTQVFVSQYIGPLAKDYIYALTPLLQDALIDRDLVRRQTACSIAAHLILGVAGLNREDAALHQLNLVWPNILETSSHVVSAVKEVVDAARVTLGPVKVMQYVLQGLFHPAHRVRSIYWRLYNSLYVSSQDALVSAYPMVPDEEDATYRRWDLEVLF